MSGLAALARLARRGWRAIRQPRWALGRVADRLRRRATRAPGAASGRRGPGVTRGIDRVHVGSGPHNLFADWWNVDVRPFPGVDEVMDATRTWPWRDLSAVYGEHFLEHLDVAGAMAFLEEAARALRPGGVLRLSTPSLEWVWRTHLDPSAGPDVLAAQTYRANRAFHGWGHRFLYSRPVLVRLLEAAGFSDLTFHAYGESDRDELRGLERHGGFEVVDGFPSVWIVEAVRGEGPAGIDPAIRAEVEHEFGRYVRSGH